MQAASVLHLWWISVHQLESSPFFIRFICCGASGPDEILVQTHKRGVAHSISRWRIKGWPGRSSSEKKLSEPKKSWKGVFSSWKMKPGRPMRPWWVAHYSEYSWAWWAFLVWKPFFFFFWRLLWDTRNYSSDKAGEFLTTGGEGMLEYPGKLICHNRHLLLVFGS